MITIVVYSSDKTFMNKNAECLNLFMSNYDGDFCICKFDKYDRKFDSFIRDRINKKIYILDISDDYLSGLSLAEKIRKFDYESFIILVSSECNCNKDLSNTRLMVLDFICCCDKYNDRLIDDIKIAISIFDNNYSGDSKNDLFISKIFTFKYKGVVNRIPFDDITYIEKESMVKRCIIHTIKNKYYITSSLSSILEQLDGSFCRSHQSCIINLNNIKKINLSNNMILFKNDEMTDMVNCKMKKEIKDYIGIS